VYENTDIILKPSFPPFVYFDPPTLTEGGESKKCARFAHEILLSPPSKPWHLLGCYGFKDGGTVFFQRSELIFFAPHVGLPLE